MTKKVFFSRTWLVAGTILFLSAACQPKTADDQQTPRAKTYVAPSKDSSCKEESCKPCGECPKKECPCPIECPKKECKTECPCPEPCKKECPCPTECPKKPCPCPEPFPKKEYSGNSEVKSDVEKNMTQSPALSESSTETTSSSPPAVAETAVAS